jgi:transposase
VEEEMSDARELSVTEQRYQAVLAVVQDGWKVSEVAERLGVSRESVHAWMARYCDAGLKNASKVVTGGVTVEPTSTSASLPPGSNPPTRTRGTGFADRPVAVG